MIKIDNKENDTEIVIYINDKPFIELMPKDEAKSFYAALLEFYISNETNIIKEK